MAVPVPGGFAGVKETNFDPLPIGTYGATVVAIEHRDSKPETVQKWANDPKNADEVAELGGVHPGYLSFEYDITEPDFDNRKAWTQAPLTRGGRGILLQHLTAVGYTREELDQEDFEIDIDGRCLGADVKLVVAKDRKAENIPGQPEATRVKKVMPADEGENDEVLP